MKRYLLMFGVMAAAGIHSRSVEEVFVTPSARADVPDAVYAAAAQGRYWRASRLLDEYMRAESDTAPATALLSARLSAGWGDWSSVIRALDGASWLDEVEHGEGWELLGRARIALGDRESGAAALARYLASGAPSPDERALVELRSGLALTETNAEAALSAFDRAADLLPWFADWSSYMAAEAAAEAGDLAEVNRRLAAAGTVGEGAWRLRVSAALTAGDTMAAREAALAATRAGSRADRSDAWAELGRLRLESGVTDRAREAFGRAMEVRSSAGAVEAARQLSEMTPSPDEWRQIAEVYQWHGNATRAAEGYERFLEAGAGTADQQGWTRLALGRARFSAGHYRQAERGLRALADSDVADAVAAEALYLLGRAQYRQGRNSAGQATFLELADRFPTENATTRGLYLLADLKHDDLETEGSDGARTYYRQAAEASPDLNEAGLSLMRLAGLEFLDGDYQRAADIWEEYLALHPNGRRNAQAGYWAARAYQRLGQQGKAKELLTAVLDADPMSYYGIQAATVLNRPVLEIPMADSPGNHPGSDSLVTLGLRRVDVLAELDRRDELVREVERLRQRFQSAEGPGAVEGVYALAEALNARGYTLTGIGMGWDLYEQSGEWNPRLLRIIYPFPYQNLVIPEALDAGLDPYLVAGLIRQESAFSPVVSSGAGAVGLMQIVPATARVLARGAGIRSFEPSLLRRPEVNVHLGTRFLAEMLDRFGDELPLVLSAYNAGPTRADEWRRMPEVDDPELFTERIPYGETRDYVRKVLQNRALYRALYSDLEETPGPAPGLPASATSLH